LPRMPRADRPVISQWIAFISDLVGEPDDRTVMIGHSLGAQAVLRYLDTIGGNGRSVGRTVLIASMYPSGMSPEEADKRTEGDRILLPWLTVAVDAPNVRKAAGKCIVILSDNDPYIPFEEAITSFRASVEAEIVVEHAKGHFNEDDNITELPSALTAVLF
jgi:predicted alpha/beta hydrolase family esterase